MNQQERQARAILSFYRMPPYIQMTVAQKLETFLTKRTQEVIQPDGSVLTFHILPRGKKPPWNDEIES